MQRSWTTKCGQWGGNGAEHRAGRGSRRGSLRPSVSGWKEAPSRESTAGGSSGVAWAAEALHQPPRRRERERTVTAHSQVLPPHRRLPCGRHLPAMTTLLEQRGSVCAALWVNRRQAAEMGQTSECSVLFKKTPYPGDFPFVDTPDTE